MIDLIATLRDLVEADTTVTDLVGTRVYGLELPPANAKNMPQNAVVLKPAGGPGGIGGDSYVYLHEVRIDVFNYGATGVKAYQVARATHDAMKNIERDINGDTLFHRALQSSGPVWLRDPQGDWPLVLESWLVLASESTAA